MYRFCAAPELAVAAASSPDRDQRIAAVRRFSRFYTRQIGLLQDGMLASPFSLAEARVLYELAQRRTTTASALAGELGLDPGYLSRMLRGFSQRGLEFRESLFDWIEVWAIGWQIAHCRAGLLDCLPNAFDFVAGKIVSTISPSRKTGARKCST